MNEVFEVDLDISKSLIRNLERPEASLYPSRVNRFRPKALPETEGFLLVYIWNIGIYFLYLYNMKYKAPKLNNELLRSIWEASRNSVEQSKKKYKRTKKHKKKDE